MFEKATNLKEKLDKLRLLPYYTVKSIRDKLLLDWTYNSNAIEGNTLTLIETKVVLEGITIGGKSLREHWDFVKIHPFIDGNGRTARLLLNLELMKGGYPTIVIQNKERVSYYESLDKAHTKADYKDFIKIVEKEVINSLMLYLSLIN